MGDIIVNYFYMLQLSINRIWNNVLSNKQTSSEDIINSNVEEPFLINFNIDKLMFDIDKIGLIRSVYKHSNVKKSPVLISNFHFLYKINITKNFVAFASDFAGCDYAIEKKTGEIILIDFNSKDFLLSIAKDEISFLQILTKLLEFESLFIKGVKMQAETSIKFREECIRLAGGEKYSKLYRFIVISENDKPDEQFTLP